MVRIGRHGAACDPAAGDWREALVLRAPTPTERTHRVRLDGGLKAVSQIEGEIGAEIGAETGAAECWLGGFGACVSG